MQSSIIEAGVKAASAKLVLSMASTPEEVREVQRLRYKVFIETLGLTSLMREDRLDVDEFDEYCDHLIVRNSDTLEVVGTYRLLNQSRAPQAGSPVLGRRIRYGPPEQRPQPHR